MSVIIISFLYSLVGVVGLVGFIPQIIKIIKAENDDSTVSISSWLLWSVTGLVSMLYGIIVVNDLLIIVITCINFVGCLLITILEIYNRFWRFKVKN